MAQGIVFVSEVGLQPLHRLVPVICSHSSQLFTNALIQILPFFSFLCFTFSLLGLLFLLCSCHSQLPTASGTWVNLHSPSMNWTVSLKTFPLSFLSISTQLFHSTSYQCTKNRFKFSPLSFQFPFCDFTPCCCALTSVLWHLVEKKTITWA